MKSQKPSLVLMFLFISLQLCFGQAALKAELVDEFSYLSCEDFRHRIDNFVIELAENPNLQGYVYITGKEDDLRKKVGYELLIKGQIALRNFDKSRVSFIRNTDTKNFKVQLWEVPAGAVKPDFKKTNWNFVFPLLTKPFLFHDDFEGENYCPPLRLKRFTPNT